MKSTIGRKISAAFFVILLLMGAMVGITFRGLDNVISSLDNIELEAVKRGASGNLRFSIAQLLMAGNDYIITQNEYYQREYNRLSAHVDDFYHQFLQLPLTEEERQLITEIKQDLDSIRAYSAQIFSIQHPRQSPKAWALMETMDYRFGDDVNRKTTEIFDGISRRIEEHRLLAAANKENALNSMYGAAFLAVVITLVVSYLTVQRISKPIITVTKAANGIANGDYSQRPVVKTHDEVAVLAESFCRMAESIQQSQHTLRKSEKQYRDLFESTSDLIQAVAPDGRVLFVNRAWREALGYTEEELGDLNIDRVVHPDALTQCFETLQRAMSGEQVDRIETRFVTKDGKSIIVEGSVACRFEASQPVAVTCFLRDITERREAEETLAEREKRYSALFNLSPSGIVLEDTEGNIVDVNEAFCKSLGYTREELVGKNVRMVASPEQLPAIEDHIAKLRSGKMLQHVIQDVRKDGTLCWMELHETSISLASGQQGFLVVAHDITESKRAEEALRASEAKYHMLVEQVPTIIYTTSLGETTATLYISPQSEAVLGYSPDEWLADPEFWLKHLHPDDRERVASQYARAALTGEPFRAEYRMLTRAGRVVWLHDEAVVVRSGESLCLQGIALDITERKLAEEENRLLLTFTQTIAEAEDFNSALSAALRMVSESTAWDFGEAWVPSSDGAYLECSPSWYTSFENAGTFRTTSEQFKFERGVGLPGRVWASKKPAWIPDVTVDANFPRAPFAKEIGFKAAVGIPILAEKDVVAVIAFFLREVREEDERMVALVSAVAAQLGTLFQRKQAEETLRKKDEHHRNVIESIFKFVPEGVLVLTESLNLLKHNKAFDDIVQKYAPLLGYTEEGLAEKIIEQLRSKMLSGDTTEIRIPKKSE